MRFFVRERAVPVSKNSAAGAALPLDNLSHNSKIYGCGVVCCIGAVTAASVTFAAATPAPVQHSKLRHIFSNSVQPRICENMKKISS